MCIRDRDYKMDTRMELADRLLDDLISSATASEDELLNKASTVLYDWDRCANNDSRVRSYLKNG